MRWAEAVSTYRLMLIRSFRELDQVVTLDCETDAEAIGEMGYYSGAALVLELWRGESLVIKAHAPAEPAH